MNATILATLVWQAVTDVTGPAKCGHTLPLDKAPA